MKNIILIGFMGTGKSEVGRCLATALGMTFVDTDSLIVQRTETDIPRLFKDRGEAGFRAIEKEVVDSLVEMDEHVIATGGGAVIDPDNLSLLRSLGPIVHLRANPEVILKRTGGNAGTRPMLAGDDALARIQELQTARAEYYNQADYSVDTSVQSIHDVTQEILTLVQDKRRTIRVDLGSKSYDIVIGPSMLGQIGPMMKTFKLTKRTLVVTNPGLRKLYGDVVKTSLQAAGFEPTIIEVPDGEAQKSLEWASTLYDAMLAHRMDRQSPVIALGGGVIGDLTGFVAATYMRGIPFIQVPTSLLAQVDASVGGKVAVDHPRGKNLIGAFYQPKLVLISLNALHSLSDRELRAGMAEVIKYGMIADADFFDYLDQHLSLILNRDVDALAHIVARSCEIKAEVVAGDEREQGRRAILNFGHTIGHAVETHTGLLHGEAIATGMIYAARIAERMNLLGRRSVTQLTQLIERAGLPIHQEGLDVDAIMATMMHDKKTVGGHLHFILPNRIGEVEIRNDVRKEDIRAVMSE
jgi:shikimate kinase / 3-dehydroquinate synthase